MDKKTKGVALIELLIYISIFIILITAITLFAINFTETVTKTRVKREISLAAFSGMKAMLYEIKRAENIYRPTSVFNNHPGQLSLQTRQGASSGEELTYIDFYLDSNNRLFIKREGYDPQLLISDNFRVANLEFDYLASSSESTQISLTLEYDTPVSKYQYSYSLKSSGTIRK